MRRHHELPFGAERVADGVRFRLWAPGSKSVMLLLDSSSAGVLPMHSEDGGWWALTTDAAAVGTRYRYRVDGMEVPDPASRYQPDGVHAASEVIDSAAYRWTDTDWHGRPWEEMVIYELHVGAFSVDGTFASAIPHLDE